MTIFYKILNGCSPRIFYLVTLNVHAFGILNLES